MEKPTRFDLNWNYLQYFCSVAEHKSVKQAAADLGVSSSTVSEGIQNLEAKLCCKLLSRHTRRVELTAQGGSLYNRLKPIFEKQHQILESIDVKNLELPSVRVGLVRSNTLPASMQILELVLKFAGATKFVVQSCDHETLERALQSGEIDVGLSDARTYSRNATSVKIGDCRMRFFVHRDLASRPLNELLPDLKIGLLGTGNIQQEVQNRLSQAYPDIRPQYLITDYASLLYQSCLQKRAIIGYASKTNVPVNPEFCELNDPALTSADVKSEHFLSWANRLEGSAFHEFLLEIVRSVA